VYLVPTFLKKDVESTVKYIAEGLKKPGAQVKKGWRSRSGSSFTQKNHHDGKVSVRRHLKSIISHTSCLFLVFFSFFFQH